MKDIPIKAYLSFNGAELITCLKDSFGLPGNESVWGKIKLLTGTGKGYFSALSSHFKENFSFILVKMQRTVEEYTRSEALCSNLIIV